MIFLCINVRSTLRGKWTDKSAEIRRGMAPRLHAQLATPHMSSDRCNGSVKHTFHKSRVVASLDTTWR